jgi:membrane-associated phospholipid phosphatase
LRTRGHARPVEAAVARLSRLGEHGSCWYVLALVGAAVDPGGRPLYLRALRATAAAYAANQVVKLAVRRRRPRLEDLDPLAHTLSQLSYPSAHASTSFAAARSLSPALPAPPLYALATLMALSRPYLGIHYPTDTAAGAVLGTAVETLVP